MEIELHLPDDYLMDRVFTPDNQLESSLSDDSSKEEHSNNENKSSASQKHEPHPPSAPISADSRRHRRRQHHHVNEQTPESLKKMDPSTLPPKTSRKTIQAIEPIGYLSC